MDGGSAAFSTDRDRAWERLASQRFDLLVVGGGIIGAGLAAEASRYGLSVALVDRADFAAATSSASTKLVHGGLRYLRMGDVRLVREAHSERRALMRAVAPHLVQPMSFLFPLYRRGPYGPLMIQAGLWTYSALSLKRPRWIVKPEDAVRLVPDLRLEGLRSCGIYEDSWTHDSRLTLLNLRAAAEAGATVLNYAEVAALRIAGGRVEGAEVADRLGSASASVTARVVVNATGPWVDAVRRLEDPAAPPSSRLSKGVHITLPDPGGWSAALTVPQDKVRVSFAVPWEGMLVLGTTDTKYEGDPGDVEATEEDIREILGEAEGAVDSHLLAREKVLAAYAGLRVLPGVGDDTATVRRGTVLMRGPAGMLSVAGGKLTTYREIARHALGELQADLGLHRIENEEVPLPGAMTQQEAAGRIGRVRPELDEEARRNLAHLYGGLAEEVLAPADGDPSLLERVHPDAPDLLAQVAYAGRAEWACSPDDVLRRRTTLALRGLATSDVVARVERHLGGERAPA
jgi:glycerol-3-phosphate dehydrogenase